MIFAVLFVISFVIGLFAYMLTGKWLTAAIISMSIFALNTAADSQGLQEVGITLLLGLPVVFVASLFGAYVIELRRGLNEVEEPNEEQGSEAKTTKLDSDQSDK